MGVCSILLEYSFYINQLMSCYKNSQANIHRHICNVSLLCPIAQQQIPIYLIQLSFLSTKTSNHMFVLFPQIFCFVSDFVSMLKILVETLDFVCLACRTLQLHFQIMCFQCQLASSHTLLCMPLNADIQGSLVILSTLALGHRI